MQAFSVIKHLDIVKESLSRLLLIPIPFSVHPFCFQCLENSLRDSIVIAVSLATHTPSHLVPAQLLPERFAYILYTSIRVQNYSQLGLPMQKLPVQSDRHRAVDRQSAAE